ncbi:MAG: response regulator [Vicinamibacterales bacterium]
MPPSHPARVLIVDDEAQIRSVVRAILETAHRYEVDEVDDGARALTRVEQWEPELVITDLVMPNQEGMGLIRKLRQSRPNLKIIAISGARGGAYLPVAKTMGANATLAKPFDPATLLAQVRQVLESTDRAA